jgi:hypothetical protein
VANDRWYNPGDYYQLDDLSGFKIRASRSRKIPGGQTGGLIVAPERWEPQQPQDFVTGVVDEQWVPEPRPRQQNRYTWLATFVTAPSARGTGVITVDSTVGWEVGDNAYLMLDSGEQFLTSIAAILGHSIYLGTALPFSVGTLFGDPIENSFIFYQDGPPLVTGFYSNGGVLGILYPSLLPTSSAVAGAVYDNGGSVGIVAGAGPGSAVRLFNQVSQGSLVLSGASSLPTSAASGSLRLWNNGGEVQIA